MLEEVSELTAACACERVEVKMGEVELFSEETRKLLAESQAFVNALSDKEVEDLVIALMQSDDEQSQQLLPSLVERWAKVSPRVAISFIRRFYEDNPSLLSEGNEGGSDQKSILGGGGRSPGLIRTVVYVWSDGDAVGAWRYLRDEAISRSVQGSIFPGYSNFHEEPSLESMVMPRLAQQDPEMAWHELQVLSREVFSKSVLMGFLNHAPASFDFSRVTRSYRELNWEDQSPLPLGMGVNDPPSKLISRLMESDPDGAVRWYQRNKDELWKAPTERGKVFSRGPARNDLAWAVANWLARDGGNAAPWLEEKLSAGEREFVGEVLTAQEIVSLYLDETGKKKVGMGEPLAAFKGEYEEAIGREPEVMRHYSGKILIEKPVGR
ncbi:hypothetical protein V2O64_18100 [Verrucomicrobiaceae bacterium 227]